MPISRQNAADETSDRSGLLTGMLRRAGSAMALTATAFFSLAFGPYAMAAQQSDPSLIKIRDIVVYDFDCQGKVTDPKRPKWEGGYVLPTHPNWIHRTPRGTYFGPYDMAGVLVSCKLADDGKIKPLYTVRDDVEGVPGSMDGKEVKVGNHVTLYKRVLRGGTDPVYEMVVVLSNGEQALKTSK